MMRGVKRGGIGVFAGWASGLVALPCGLRLAWRRWWALPCGRRRRCPEGWAWVAAPWGYFDGAKIRFCLKENRFFGILHDEKAADCGGVLQAYGREPRASASLQPDALRPCPDGGASLGAGGAPLPAATRSHAPSPTTCGDGSGSEGKRRGEGAGGWRCGGVSVGSERAGERE